MLPLTNNLSMRTSGNNFVFPFSLVEQLIPWATILYSLHSYNVIRVIYKSTKFILLRQKKISYLQLYHRT